MKKTALTYCQKMWLFTAVAKFHFLEVLVLCYPISWILAAIVFLITYLRGNWLRKRIAACGLEPEIR